MSEETTPAKKAARKSSRKKSAAKRASKKVPKSGVMAEEKELALDDPADSVTEPSEASKPREPKSGIRDARRETVDEPLPPETIEKLVSNDDETKSLKEDSESGAAGKAGSGKNTDASREKGPDREKPESSERKPRGRGRRERTEKREPRPRILVDTKDLAKKAWKIFESEVTEEGLALLDDNGLRDYARSSFNAARLFLEEKDRVFHREKQAEAEKKRQEKLRKEQKKEESKDEENDD